MVEHKRRTDPDGPEFHERATDTDFWARTAQAIDRYKILWLVLMALSAWLGSHLMQPLKAVPVMAQQIRVLQASDSVAGEERREIKRAVAILTRIQCFNIPRDDRLKYDVDCGEIPTPE